MSALSTNSQTFTDTIKRWFTERQELLVLFLYANAGGNREYYFFSSANDLMDHIGTLRSKTCVVVYRYPQLPIRGVIDDTFEARCFEEIPASKSYLLIERVKRVYGKASWYHYSWEESRDELRNALEFSRGVLAAAGIAPDWPGDPQDEIDAYVPDADGIVRPGAY